MEQTYLDYVIKVPGNGSGSGFYLEHEACGACILSSVDTSAGLYDVASVLGAMSAHEIGAHGRGVSMSDARQHAPASIYLVARGDGDAVAAWTDRKRAYEYAYNVKATVVELATKRDYRPTVLTD